MTGFQEARAARERPARHERRRRELRDLLAAGVLRPAEHGAFPLRTRRRRTRPSSRAAIRGRSSSCPERRADDTRAVFFVAGARPL
ncbi:hypothetical protein ACH49_23260 [Streptomyces leeuwenhoekii]|uniref:Uncharacterized protein n=1 Tax=Streptomyces leeuwenhoekii TaxID=1437453 RepID=A0ABR5HTS4_STRLW|nr:hypothetical protein ACH49_23260 [Streptomyces leeuwenhoekii]